ncbi:MAG: outer membrane protein assembly factor BamD [Chlorobiaceae bacterium]|nr:outer membrane protein assembly factor BamD [Chlorobiaceae bacterium]
MSLSAMRKPVLTFVPGLLCLVLLLSSCSSSKLVSKKPVQEISVEQRYREATDLIAKKKYDKAILRLDPMMFSTRATDLEDDVLHSLGDAYFLSGQYLLSADVYRRLLQQTPDSPYAKDAQYQLARSYEKMSPGHELDQEYTVKAMAEFQNYLDQYPAQESSQAITDVETYRELLKVNPNNFSYKSKYNAAMADLARQSPANYCSAAIPVLREKLAHNRYSIALQYVKLKKYRSAVIFYDQIIVLYPDTKWLEPAWLGKIDMNVKRNKWFEARQAIEQYQQLFPDKTKKVEGAYKKVLENFSNSRQPAK